MVRDNNLAGIRIPTRFNDTHYAIFRMYSNLQYEPTLTQDRLSSGEGIDVTALTDLVNRGDLDIIMEEHKDGHIINHCYLTEKGE
jgi:hypothetical protein